MDIVKEMYIEDSIEDLQKLLKYDEEGFYTEKDVNNHIEYVINNLQRIKGGKKMTKKDYIMIGKMLKVNLFAIKKVNLFAIKNDLMVTDSLYIEIEKLFIENFCLFFGNNNVKFNKEKFIAYIKNE